MNVMKLANLIPTSKVTKLVNAASKYAPAMKKAASMMPQGRVTVGLNSLKTLNTKKFPGLAELIKATELIGAKNPTITLASKAAKIHKGGLMTGVVLKDGKNVIARGAALINPQAGKASAINLKLRSALASVNSVFNPNEINANMLDNYFASVMMKGGKVHNNLKVGNAFKLHTIVDNNKYQRIFFEDPNTIKNAIAPEIDKIRNLLVNGKKPEGTLNDTFSKVLEKVLENLKNPFKIL